MFGIGYPEMMVLALAALLIFGPGKLPEVMREAGQQYRKFRELTSELTGEMDKLTAEARKELDGVVGDLGPIGKDLEKQLGTKKTPAKGVSNPKGSVTTTSKPSGSLASGSAGKTTTTKKATTSSTTKTTPASKSASATKPATSTTATKTAQQSQPKTTVASKEDPLAGFTAFEAPVRESRRPSRSAVPSNLTDLTPRLNAAASEKTVETPEDIAGIEDPLARARARRRHAGYARA